MTLFQLMMAFILFFLIIFVPILIGAYKYM